VTALVLFLGALLAETAHYAIGHRAALIHAARILPAWTRHRARRWFVNTGTRVKPRAVTAEQPAIAAPTRLELTSG
jgi:hypothetical protein